MTAAQVALQVQAELAINDHLLERLKQGDPSAFDKLNLNFEQIYASAEPQFHGLQEFISTCSIVVCTSGGPCPCETAPAEL